MQKSNSVTQTVESLEKTHYRICFSDLITWVTTPSQSATSNDILLRPDIKTINQPSCLIEEPKTSTGGHEIQSPDFRGVFACPIKLTTYEPSNLTNAIKSALYIHRKTTNTQKSRKPLSRTKNTEPEIKSIEINDKLSTKVVPTPNSHHVRGSRTSSEIIKLVNEHKFIRPESESAKMQNYESKRAFRCRYEYLDYSHIPDNTTDRNNSRGKPRLRR